jgi:hypothetical protein
MTHAQRVRFGHHLHRRDVLRGAVGTALPVLAGCTALSVAVPAHAQDSANRTPILKRTSLDDRPPEELAGLWQRAGFLSALDVPAPDVDLSHMGDEFAYSITAADDPATYFPNLSTVSSLQTNDTGAHYFDMQAEYVTSSVVSVETSEGILEGQLVHVRIFCGDHTKGDVIQRIICLAAGWRKNATFASRDIHFRLAAVGSTRPSIPDSKSGFRPVEDVVAELDATEEVVVAAVQCGVNYSFGADIPDQAAEVGFPRDLFDPELAMANSEAQKTSFATLQDISLLVAGAQDHVLRMYRGNQEGIAIGPHMLHSNDPLETLVAALPASANVIERTDLTLEEFIQLPRMTMGFGVTVPDIPGE